MAAGMPWCEAEGRWGGAVTLALAVLMLACTGEPFSKRVGPGSTVAIALPQAGLEMGVTLAYGSTMGGVDTQRGELRFVLCQTNRPNCDPSATLNPRQGYRMKTLYATRVGADALSLSGMNGDASRIAMAYFEVPASGNDRPPMGTYRLEPRVAAPNVAERIAVSENLIHTMEILASDGLPSPLTDGGVDQLNGLKNATPKPALRLMVAQPSGQPLAEAVDLRLTYPSAKVRILGVGGTGATALVEHLTVDTTTIRIFFLRDATAPPPLPDMAGNATENVIDVAFELIPEAPDLAKPADFTIVQQASYDKDGKLVPGAPRVTKGGIF